jgi:DNA-binding transcriptional regulator YdaS (Cro superfamily)
MTEQMQRWQLRRVFQRHHGEATKLAREINVCRTTVSQWLRGRLDSAKVEDAVRRRAAELIAAERVKRTPELASASASAIESAA